MSYYPESNSHSRDKVKVVLYWTHYATKIEIERAPGVDTFNLAAKKKQLKSTKLDIAKLVNFAISSNYLKTKLDDSDVPKLKIVPVDLKKLSAAVDKQVLK